MSEQNQNEQDAPSELTDTSLENVAGGCHYPILIDGTIDIIDVINGPDLAF